MTFENCLLIILILFLGWVGYVIYKISLALRDNVEEISRSIADRIQEFANVLENIRIPAIRLETRPFEVNVTKDIKASWVRAREDKINMIEQTMMTAEQLLNYRDKLQTEYLASERTDRKDEMKIIKAKIEAVEIVMGIKV